MHPRFFASDCRDWELLGQYKFRDTTESISGRSLETDHIPLRPGDVLMRPKPLAFVALVVLMVLHPRDIWEAHPRISFSPSASLIYSLAALLADPLPSIPVQLAGEHG